MTYETVTYYSQMATLFIFPLMLAGALLHALLPGFREEYKHAAQIPLLADDDNDVVGGNA